jgi:DNA-binding response OmpR family regulator
MKKVLIIEDDDDILELVSFILAENGFETITSKHKISVDKVLEIAPQLILLDYYLPTGLGDSFCLELKNNPASKHLPIVMFSSANGLKEIAEGNCADAYILKPFDLYDFLTTVNKYILSSVH